MSFFRPAFALLLGLTSVIAAESEPPPALNWRARVWNTSEDPQPPIQPWFGRRLLRDLGQVVTAPVRWDGTDWAITGACVAGTVATGIFIDRYFQNESQDSRTANKDTWSGQVGQLGTISSFIVIGGTGLIGWASDNDRLWNTAVDATEASIIASGVITPTLKFIVGRSRPTSSGQDSDVFNPFSGDVSFPSGHATQAFTVATVFACSYRDQPWVGALAYAAATGVGLSRINNDAHYLSDVVAGGIIGTFVGYQVCRYNRERRGAGERHSRWSPAKIDVAFGGDTQSVGLTWRW